MRNHKEVRVWQRARDLTALVYACTKTFPRSELFGLTAQIRRSAISIASNIAEGAARRSSRDFGRFLDIAIGSAAELQAQLDLARLVGISDDDCLARAEVEVEQVKKMLSGLLRVVRRRATTDAGGR